MKPIPYSRQIVDDTDIAAVIAVLRSNALSGGPELPRFEAAFSKCHAVAHALALSSATSALHLACLALGVQQGSRVWTSPNSFVTTANCAMYCGATVDFVDIDPLTRNMSIAALRDKLFRAERQGLLPQVLIPVHFAGMPCDLAEMRELADRYGFAILEDASHATGASYRAAPVGTAWADASVFSFHSANVITTGQGGLVATQRTDVAERVRLLRSHGITRDARAMSAQPEGAWVYEQVALGQNVRMTDLQAALGVSQLRRLGDMQSARERLAARYDRLLAGQPLRLPVRLTDRRSAWHLYAVELEPAPGLPTRAQVYARLRAAGIGTNVHYIPIHTQPYWRALGFRRGDFPAAERWYAGALSLPLYAGLSEEEQERVVGALSAVLQRSDSEAVS